LSAEYSKGSVVSCRNGRSFTRGAFTLKKYFSPFLPFEPLVQPRRCLPLSEIDEDDDDEDEDGGALCFDLGGGGGGREGDLGDGDRGSSGRLGGTCDAHLDNLSSLIASASPSSSLMVGGWLTILLNYSD
jgi:hypothetical protein